MDYWAVHGIFSGIVLAGFLALFPRLTTLILLIFTGFLSGGVLWWLGWLFVPHILVAGLATLQYWETNPIMVVLAWMWALCGTTVEGRTVTNKAKAPRGN